jgi:glutamate transport system substrate-binding protein
MRLKSIAVMASCVATTLLVAMTPAHAADTFPADSAMAKIQKKGKLVVGTSVRLKGSKPTSRACWRRS